VCPFQINDRDFLHNSVFRVFNSQTLLPLQWQYFEVEYLMTPILRKQKDQMNSYFLPSRILVQHPPPFSRVNFSTMAYLLPCFLLKSTALARFETSYFGNIKSQLLHAHFFPKHFTWSTQSTDMCPPTYRWPLATSAIQGSKVSTLHLYFLLELTIHRHVSF